MSGRHLGEAENIGLARRAYREGEARFDFSAASSALLVIDMQDEFVKPDWAPCWVPEATRLVPRIAHLIGVCRAASVPVIYTVLSRARDSRDRLAAGTLMPDRYPDLVSDDSGLFVDGKVWHELAPAADEVVLHKPSYGAFSDTPLMSILRDLGRDTVIICGSLTDHCCGTTARQAHERGLKVVFGSDITATGDPALQEAELTVLRKGLARVLSAAEIEARLVAAGALRQR
jgi:nicotinamidase-related amidase